MDNKAYLKTLYSKLLTSTISKEELLWLQEYFRGAPVNSFQELVSESLAITDEAVDITRKEQQLVRGVYNRIASSRFEQPVSKVYSLWPRIAVAVAMAAAIVFAVFFFSPSLYPDDSLSLTAGRGLMNDIAPGKNTATLTLANGKTILLSDTKTGIIVGGNSLKYNDGSLVRDSSLGAHELLTASTPRGGMYQITLPDGTRVWLNADSKISFPPQFMGKERKISLSGEAYFEVTKNKEKPFIVESDRQKIEVLGTHFNISTYNDEPVVKTTLLEGIVRVSSPREKHSDTGPEGTVKQNSSAQAGGALGLNNSRGLSYHRDDVGRWNIVTLKPNQQAVLQNNNINIISVNPQLEIDWKNGDFVFDGETLESLMRKISRWYDVEVVYIGEMPGDILVGKVSRTKNISQVLKALDAIGIVHFKIEGRKVTVTK